MVFSSSLVRMWVLDHKEGWVPKNWCFWIVVLEKTLESLQDSKEIKPVNLKGNQPWTFIGRTDAVAPILCDAMWCEELTHWKRPWCWERLKVGGEGPTKDAKVGWHHWLNGHEFEQTLGDSGGQGSLECCSPWCHKELDMTEQLNNKNNSKILESHVPSSQVPPLVTSYIVGKTRKLTSDHHFYLDHTLYSVSTIFLACVCVCVYNPMQFFSKKHYFIYIPTVLYVHLWTVQKQYFFSNLGSFKYSKQLLKIKLSNSSPRTALDNLCAPR